MIWVWVILIVLAVLLISPIVIGRFLPEQYEARVAATLNRSPAEVWSAVMDFERHPMAGRLAKSCEKIEAENGLPCWIEDLGNTRLTVKTVESAEPSRVVREIADSVVPMTARMEIEIVPEGEGSRVTFFNRTIIRSGTWHVPIFRCVMAFFGGARRASTDFLKRLGRTLGETPQFV